MGGGGKNTFAGRDREISVVPVENSTDGGSRDSCERGDVGNCRELSVRTKHALIVTRVSKLCPVVKRPAFVVLVHESDRMAS